MKTLDEVIEQHEFCLAIGETACGPNCRWREKDGVCRMREDALHYLKEYKDAYGNVIASMNYHLRKIHELEQNDPLTWDELRQMEGKPVWVEDNTGYKHYQGWAIILKFLYSDTFMLYVCNDYSETCVDVEDLGKTWQAYRKERG